MSSSACVSVEVESSQYQTADYQIDQLERRLQQLVIELPFVKEIVVTCRHYGRPPPSQYDDDDDLVFEPEEE